MKRKIMLGALIMIVIALVIPVVAFAHGGHSRATVERPTALSFQVNSAYCDHIDADGDGICDNCDWSWWNCFEYADADGDGICDNCDQNQWHCPGYTDADENGLCDRYESGTGSHHAQGHHGQGNGCGHGRGCR